MIKLGPLRTNVGIREIVGMRAELDRLQLQLATGKRADTYAGLGAGRAPSLDARAKLANIAAYEQTIAQVDVRLTVAQSSLERFGKIASEQRGENLQTSFEAIDGRQSAQQKAAFQRLQEMVGLLNQEVDGRRLFSGRRTDADASVPVETMLLGSPPRAGLKDVIIERNRADRGATGLGRLTITQTANDVALAETLSGPFGFKIAGVGGSIDAATTTDAIGPPRTATVGFTGVPTLGTAVRVSLDLPDGSSTTLSLAASAAASGPGTFQVGTDAATTATNFAAALDAEVRRSVTSALVPASSAKAATDFFAVDAATPPTRVDVVTTPEAATAIRPATATDTVFWYGGDAATDPPRATSTARVDSAVTLGYGLRANEPGIRRVVANLALFAAVEFDPIDPQTKEGYAALSIKVRDDLADASGQTIRTIQSEVTVVQQALSAAKDRHKDTRGLLDDLIGDVEGVSKEEVATRILELQTRLEASYQATSMLSRMSLAQYL
jgi:flagellin-like hook-associated protein FlgL